MGSFDLGDFDVCDSSESDDDKASMPHWVDSFTPSIVFSLTDFFGENGFKGCFLCAGILLAFLLDIIGRLLLKN